jgi:hypothetical protein
MNASATPYTREAFMSGLQSLGMTQRAFSALTGVHPTTVYRWGREMPFPAWVPLLIRTIRHNRLLTAKRDAA